MELIGATRGGPVFEKEIESIQKVKLNGGIFGKAALVLMILIIAVSAVCFKLSTWWLILVLMLTMMAIVFYGLKRAMDFAVANPQAAVMEGAELLQHEKIAHEAKLSGRVVQLPPTTDHPIPKLEGVIDIIVDEADEVDEANNVLGVENPENKG